MPRINPREAGGANVCALLDTIAHAEIGPEMLAASDEGYNILVGSLPGAIKTFSSYATHPLPKGQAIQYNENLWSTAAGRYQILSRYWPHYQQQLGLHDFGPVNQDRYAIRQFVEQGALKPIQQGLFREAVDLIRNVWASLPNAGYGQREHDIDTLVRVYTEAGGTLHSDDLDWYDRVIKLEAT
ncbi:MAG: glycoside hydrolase family 104 protein [Pseudomonadota bacterium]|nr:glycoside hydrolase family 104 protein [Pseudomonadota bacterium]